MFSVILATLVTLQAPTPELYKIEFEKRVLLLEMRNFPMKVPAPMSIFLSN